MSDPNTTQGLGVGVAIIKKMATKKFLKQMPKKKICWHNAGYRCWTFNNDKGNKILNKSLHTRYRASEREIEGDRQQIGKYQQSYKTIFFGRK